MAWHVPTTTAVANTAFSVLIPPVAAQIPRITTLYYTTTGTEHVVTVLRPLATTFIFKTAAGSQNDIELDTIWPAFDSSGDEHTLATSDWLAWVNSKGEVEYSQVSTVNGNVLTMTTSLTRSVRKGAKVWAFYSDSDAAKTTLQPTDNALNQWEGLSIEAGITPTVDQYNKRTGNGDPLIIHSDNVTQAGTLEFAAVEYLPH